MKIQVSSFTPALLTWVHFSFSITFSKTDGSRVLASLKKRASQFSRIFKEGRESCTNLPAGSSIMLSGSEAQAAIAPFEPNSADKMTNDGTNASVSDIALLDAGGRYSNPHHEMPSSVVPRFKRYKSNFSGISRSLDAQSVNGEGSLMDGRAFGNE